jgi:hypothetical protein
MTSPFRVYFAMLCVLVLVWLEAKGSAREQVRLPVRQPLPYSPVEMASSIYNV